MKIEEVTFALVDALEACQLPYLIVGAIPTSHYGITRSTFDVDVVVQITQGQIRRLAEQLGPGFQLDPQGSFEVFTMKTMQVLYITGTPFKIDVFPLTQDPFDQQRFFRRRKVQLPGHEVVFPTAEDIVVQKLRWGREKDLMDARDVIAVQGEALDWPYIHHWCDLHGTRETLDKLRGQIPKL